ncbi:4Fe-4S ferredoxin (plasmid) [Alloyangia pacifica]|uniref:Cytochrome c-type protein NapC n=1 Tax=Alloyangia pacifica TaxID=311180 RepID=A0A2U8HL37_9RHOB|nr:MULTISPECIES: NapC/NirT family cytochrome c [Roseobacteraceae]AWI86498.1 4Fe-4S ferredoxin [Alloyangia pacifica]NDV48797.1 4Fe-4S ferredoxin [Salipiger sp. PrR003]NDW31700.1 4Fe-4S ferredoxin [Salipiger sp. PrR007]
MPDNNTHGDKPGRRNILLRIWDAFWSPTGLFSTGFLLIAGFLAGILFWGGFHWSLELTNTEEFCTSCHSMETNLGEYRQTIHYNNHSGVRAICSDCHVPHEWQYKMKAKIMAVKDVYHEVMGTINTSEKYEDRRLEMAAAVWKKMKATDSRECRNCHAFEYMDFTIQETRAAQNHQRALDEDMTCIDCHQGIAHDLAPGYLEEYQHVVETLAQTKLQDASGGVDVASIKSYLGISAD